MAEPVTAAVSGSAGAAGAAGAGTGSAAPAEADAEAGDDAGTGSDAEAENPAGTARTPIRTAADAVLTTETGRIERVRMRLLRYEVSYITA
ncbi:hypothetical protein ASF89_13245 [Frigoribacterium sp. Leaf172]|nr:hypothetical protein ASF89_13245 [Frigoribacterium sp. Leaf172]